MWRLMACWLALLFASCDASGSYAEYCDILCDCSDCGDELRQQCVEFGSEWESRARDMGCDTELSCYLGCVNAHLRCVDGRVELGAGRDDCSDERAALPPQCDPFSAQR
jgi:hypothetical protein